MGLHLGPDDHDHGLRNHVHLSSERILAAADYAPDGTEDEVCNLSFPLRQSVYSPYTGPGRLMIYLSTRVLVSFLAVTLSLLSISHDSMSVCPSPVCLACSGYGVSGLTKLG